LYRIGRVGICVIYVFTPGDLSILPVLRNQTTPLIFDPRVVLFRNILTPGHSVWVRVRVKVRVRGSIYFGGQNIS